jgi:hypothetical protein
VSSIAFTTFASSNVSQIVATSGTGRAQPQPAPAPEEDTVKLSAAAQAVTMYRAGQSVSQIASSLGTSASAVDSYLGITTAISVPTSVGHAGYSAPAQATAAPVAAKAVAKS